MQNVHTTYYITFTLTYAVECIWFRVPSKCRRFTGIFLLEFGIKIFWKLDKLFKNNFI